MSKTENAKKSRGKRTPSAEERLKDAIASCEERHRHWHELYENGTSDPFWAEVMSRVMRKIDFGIWQKSITGGGLTAPWLLFSRQGAKGQGRRYAARLALDAL